MPERRLALLSVHTSPLAQPGTGDGGGMNVYVRALASALARAGVACDVLTRAAHPTLDPVVDVEPGFRVVHLAAGRPGSVSKHELISLTDDLVKATLRHADDHGVDYSLLHANYWISGAVGHRLKHELDRPLIATFHTLARVKAEAGLDDDPLEREQVEHEVIKCSDLVLASTGEERAQLVAHYGADAERIEIVAPGVDHEVFSPGSRAQRDAARAALGHGDDPVLLFVGRIQPLKGADLALRCLAELRDAVLVVVGGPSGPDGSAELEHLHELARLLGIDDRVQFLAPLPHRRLTDLYRAADVCLVPSRTESFGLVALEAAACGTPVVAASVGGLRALVDDGVTGFLVEGRTAGDYAAPVARLLADRALASTMSVNAEAGSRRFAWSITAGRLRRLYGDLVDREPVSCQ